MGSQDTNSNNSNNPSKSSKSKIIGNGYGEITIDEMQYFGNF